MTATRMTILGSGTSAGVPVIGCDCEVCTSDDPRDRRTRTSALVETIDRDGLHRAILIDTSPDLREQALRHRMKRLDAILFTHNHVDHTFGLDEVRRFNVVMNAPIQIYAEPRTMESLARVFAHIFDSRKNVNQSFVATLVPNPLEVERPLEMFGLKITPLRFLHGRLPIVGFRFDAAESGAADDSELLPFAYCTDVSSIPPETWPYLTGLKTLVLDALRFRHHPTHFNIDQALDAASRIGAERTLLIHMTHDVRHAVVDAELPDGVSLSHDGLVVGTI